MVTKILKLLSLCLLSIIGLQCSSDTPAPVAFVAPKETCFLKKLSWGKDSSYVFSYNADNKVTKITVYKGSTEIANMAYNYDSKGRVTTMLTNWNGSQSTAKYEYDAKDQLIKFDDSATGGVTTITYDNVGRVQQTVFNRTDYTDNRSYNYTTNNNISKIDFGRLTAEYTYDDKRNPLRNLPAFTGLIPQFFLGKTNSGVAEQNCYNNALTVTKKFDGSDYISKMTYTYNSQGYPTTVTCNFPTVSGLTSTATASFEYTCP